MSETEDCKNFLLPRRPDRDETTNARPPIETGLFL